MKTRSILKMISRFITHFFVQCRPWICGGQENAGTGHPGFQTAG